MVKNEAYWYEFFLSNMNRTIVNSYGCCIVAYIYIFKYMRNIIKQNDDFNERSNTLLCKNISLTLYSRKGWCWLCVRGELEMGTDCYILTQVLLTNHGSLRAQSPLSATGSHFGILSPTDSNSNWLKPSVSWLYFCLMPTCFRCSSAYLHSCISWLTARLRVNMLHG